MFVILVQEDVIHNGSEPLADGEVETVQTPEAETPVAEEKEKSATEEANDDNKVKKEEKKNAGPPPEIGQ